MSKVCYSGGCPFHPPTTGGYDCEAAELCPGFCERCKIIYSDRTSETMKEAGKEHTEWKDPV